MRSHHREDSVPYSILILHILCALFLSVTPISAAPDAQYSKSCNDCHGIPPKDSTFRNLTTGAFIGSHQQHATSSPSSCTRCHPGSASFSYDHMTSVVFLAANINNSPGGGKYRVDGNQVTFYNLTSSPVTGTCTNVNCHFESLTPQWGSTPYSSANDCANCHAVPGSSSSHAKHNSYYSWPANGCPTCHPDHKTGLMFNHATSAGQRGIAVILNEGSYTGDGLNYLPSQNISRNLGTCSNLYCHSNGNGGTPYVAPVWGGTLPADCTGCHGGNTISFRPISTGKHGIHIGKKPCGACHSATVTEVNDRSVTGAAAHVDGSKTIQFTGAGSYIAGSKSCNTVQCHGNTSATWGSISGCLRCHSATQGNRVAIGPQLDNGSHHIQGSVTDSKCYQCHWEANSDGSINPLYHEGSALPGAPVHLVIYGAGTRPATYTPGITAVQYHYTTTVNRTGLQNITTHCLGCHSDQNNAAQPFGDGKTPKQYAWDGTSIAARYSQSGVTTWGKYSTVANAAQKRISKALSAHGNALANKRGWNSSTGVDGAIANTSGGVNVQCYDCHNSHGSSAQGITSRYSSATGRKNGAILKSTLAGLGGYAVSYRPYSAGSGITGNKRNPGATICLDCHLTQTNTATPWGYNVTFGTTQAILGYWDAPRFNGFSSSGAEQRFPYKTKNSIFGGHFGASAALSVTPTANIDGLCTPCHDPHGVTPTLGAKQRHAVPLLKGTWITSPYKEDVAPVSDTPYTGVPGYEGVQYHIDQNTFASGGVTEPESQSEGLCLGCHPKNSLTVATNPSSPNAWKSKNRIHESVKGWKSSNGTVKHNYSCSKCHAPHDNSVLPRLMVTNCLDGKHKGRSGYNPYSVTSGSSWGDGGSGSGRIPGYYNGSGWGDYPNGPNAGYNGIVCHESATANGGDGTDQAWNTVTAWAQEPATTIASGPAAGSITAVGSNIQATISWTTNNMSSSYVDYGLTTAYGSTAGNAGLVKNHSMTLQNLVNHSTYHYRVRSVSYSGQAVASGDLTFTTSLPPTVPVLTHHSDAVCPSDCSQSVSWNAASDPDGGTVEYYVEIDTSTAFDSANKQSSGWISATNASFTIATANTWYWRVKSRDAGHVESASAFSAADSFRTVTTSPPPAPTVIAHGNYDSGCADTAVTVSWNPVTAPDNDPVQYRVTNDYGAVKDSGWLAAGQTNWSFTNYAGFGITWKVMARDSVHSDAISAWSATDYFYDIGSTCVSSSCPLVYTWDGTRFNYQSDLQGPILMQSGGTRNVSLYQPVHMGIQGLVPDGDNRYRIKIWESLSEATLLDEAKLLVVDYPAGYQLVTSGAENTYNYGYLNPLSFHTIKDPALPRAATDKFGNDILSTVLDLDDTPIPVVPDDPDNYYTFDFGEIAHPEYAKLVIDGWSIYNSKLYTYIPPVTVQPYIEVVDTNGTWVKAKVTGTPTGDLKTMVVDIADIFESSDHRIRIHLGIKRTSRWVIDRIRLDDSAPVSISVREIPPSAADLQMGGQAIRKMSSLQNRIITSEEPLPLKQDSFGYGNFTRYGDVLSLITQRDDKYVIMRYADKLELMFPAPGNPLPGMTRGFVLKADLYYKEFNTYKFLEPLPFHSMTTYPYAAPEAYPADSDHNQYQLEFNTRRFTP